MGGRWHLGDSVRDDVIIYDVCRNTWIAGSDLPERSSTFDACIIGDTIWFAGIGADTVMRKGAIDPTDPTHITWSAGPILPDTTRWQWPCIAMDGKVFFFGGRSRASSEMMRQGWVFDPVLQTFDTLPLIPFSGVAWLCSGVARESTHEIYKFASELGGEWPPETHYYRLRVLPPTSIAEQSPEASKSTQQLAILGHGVLWLTLRAGDRRQTAHLLDASGRSVLKLHSGANDVGNLSPGVYFVSQESPGEGGCTRKVVLTK